MRIALARLGAAYIVLAAGVCGGVMMAMPPTDGPQTATRSWFELLQLRINPPPETVSVTIGPWAVPLRRVLYDVAPEPDLPTLRPALEIAPDRPADPDIQSPPASETPPVPVVPPPAVPRTIPIIKIAPPRITRFATDEPLPLVQVLSETVPALVEERLRNNLSRDLYAHFDLFLYVSKSAKGPLAQHMYVFAKDRGKGSKAQLKLLHDWPVSTGREAIEHDIRGARSSTVTPVGFYQLDPKRFYRRYNSVQWGKPMPNSMFFDWVDHGLRTGLAIHGVTDAEEVAALGSRASSGCVHLSPDAAASLFTLVKTDYRGMVPQFAYDRGTKTISNQGEFARDKNGQVRMMEGYRALVVIENYDGQNMMSELHMDSAKPEG